MRDVNILWKFIFNPGTMMLGFDEVHGKAKELKYRMFAFNGSIYPTSPSEVRVSEDKLFDLSELGMDME